MSELEDKLQSILGDPEAMGQIMSLAQAITGKQGAEGSPAEGEPDGSAVSAGEGAADGEMAPVNAFSLLEDLDPRLLQMGLRLLSEYRSTDERKTALLTALRPFVRKDRYAKVDRAIQIARLSHVIRTALDAFQKGDEDRV